jgi:hypothetical protein
MNMTPMTVKNVQTLSCFSTPYPGICIIAAGYNQVAMNLDVSNLGGMAPENAAWLETAGLKGPESNSTVSRAGNDGVVVKDGKAAYSRIMRFERLQVCSDTIP